MCDVLDRDPRARQQLDETVPQLSGCPFLCSEPSVLGHLAEGTPNVGRVERGAKLRREDEHRDKAEALFAVEPLDSSLCNEYLLSISRSHVTTLDLLSNARR
jgi:hypothetical protein